MGRGVVVIGMLISRKTTSVVPRAVASHSISAGLETRGACGGRVFRMRIGRNWSAWHLPVKPRYCNNCNERVR
jgi:hypothetical protein